MTKDEIKDLIFSKVQVRDTLTQRWVDSTLVGFIYGSDKPFLTVSGNGHLLHWFFMRPMPQTAKAPFTKETAPRHLEIEVEDGSWVVAVKKDAYGAHFDDIIISWENLMRFKQWDGSPCYVEGKVRRDMDELKDMIEKIKEETI